MTASVARWAQRPNSRLAIWGQNYPAVGAQEVRVLAARLPAAKGASAEPVYPDISTREKAAAVSAAFVEGKAPRLLP